MFLIFRWIFYTFVQPNCTAKFCVLIDINNCMGYNILTGFNSQVMTCVIFEIINNILKEKGDI